MKTTCAHALADIAAGEVPDVVREVYGEGSLQFGPDYLIPKPFDPRLILEIAPTVAQTAMDDGVATRPLPDIKAYRERLHQFVSSGSFSSL